MKMINNLDVTFNLNDGTYKPYIKPNNEIKYIHKNSNHPPTDCHPANPTIHRIKVIYPIF